MIVMLYSHIVGRTPFIFSLNTHTEILLETPENLPLPSMLGAKAACQPASQLALFKKDVDDKLITGMMTFISLTVFSNADDDDEDC